MGIYISQNEKGELSIQPDSYKKDFKLTQWVTNTLNAQLKYESAQADGNVEKAIGTITRPDGTVSPVTKSAAIHELAKAAETWQGRALEPGLDGDLKQWLLQKAQACRAEVDRLEGREVREPVAKPVSFTIPR